MAAVLPPRDDPFECEKCNCHGHSDQCHYDQVVHLTTAYPINSTILEPISKILDNN